MAPRVTHNDILPELQNTKEAPLFFMNVVINV